MVKHKDTTLTIFREDTQVEDLRGHPDVRNRQEGRSQQRTWKRRSQRVGEQEVMPR